MPDPHYRSILKGDFVDEVGFLFFFEAVCVSLCRPSRHRTHYTDQECLESRICSASLVLESTPHATVPSLHVIVRQDQWTSLRPSCSRSRGRRTQSSKQSAFKPTLGIQLSGREPADHERACLQSPVPLNKKLIDWLKEYSSPSHFWKFLLIFLSESAFVAGMPIIPALRSKGIRISASLSSAWSREISFRTV